MIIFTVPLAALLALLGLGAQDQLLVLLALVKIVMFALDFSLKVAQAARISVLVRGVTLNLTAIFQIMMGASFVMMGIF
jgi:hypothetical protein